MLEARDARLQHLGHPDLNSLGSNVVKKIIFNKIDLLSSNAQKSLYERYHQAFYFSNRQLNYGHSIKDIVDWVLDNASDTYEQQLVHVVGYPNTGKSTLINQLRNSTNRRSKLKTGNIAGITRKIEKVRFLDSPRIDLLDFPGVLVPPSQIEFEDAIKLSLIGSCKFNNVDPFLESHFLICYLKDFDPSALASLKVDANSDFANGEMLINQVGSGFKIYKKGNIVDLEKTSKFIVQRFKDGKVTTNPFL